MGAAKIAITLDEDLLKEVDLWVRQGRFPTRSRAIQSAVQEKLRRWKRTRLLEALDGLDPAEERAQAEEWLQGEEWPES